MIIVYEFALSPFVQKVKIALREKGVGFETRAFGSDGFADGNPRLEVPLFVDGDVRIWDSTIILDYIDEKWPDPPLLTGDAAARARSRMLEELADTRLEALNYCIGEAMAFPAGADEAARNVIEASRAEVRRLHGELEEALGEAAYFGGPTPDRADFSLLPLLNAARVMKNGPDDGPLADWLGRMNQRPSVRETVAEVKAGIPQLKAMMAEVASGEAKRQMRDHRLDWMMSAGGAELVMKRLDGLRFSRAE